MTTEVLAATLTANAESTFGQGRVWYVKAATAALTIIAQKLGTGAVIRRFINVGAGFKFKAREGEVGWDYLRVTSAVNQNIEIIIGDDDVEVANAVTVTGSVVTADQPMVAVADTAAVVRLTATQGALFAANPSRRRLRVFVDSLNLPSGAGVNCFLRSAGGVNNIGELVPGLSYPFDATYGLDVRNDTGNTWTFYILEES